MKERLNRLWKSSKEIAASQTDRALEYICAGLVVNASGFVLGVFC